MNTISAKFIAPVALALTSIVALAAPPAPIDSANYLAPIRLACVGDSLTVLPEGKSYPVQLQPLLGDKWLVKSFAVSGRTLLKKGDFPYWNEQAYKDALAFLPNVVIILLGTNDCKAQNWAHHDDFHGDYKELIESFKNLGSKPRIFICYPCPLLSANYGMVGEYLQLELPIIDQLAVEENAGIIDMKTPMLGKPQLFQADLIHPNADGAGVMARTVADALTGKTQKKP